jgi:putative endonuclease
MSNAGQIGEDRAARFLRTKNYKILARNYHSRFGEIDIIAQKNRSIIFVEVKTRSSNKFGTPAEAVNYFKLQKLIKTAHIFMKVHQLGAYQFQFDVIEVMGREESFDIVHRENVTL